MYKMRRPVVLLEKALYGHPLAGAFWHEYCSVICKAAGFRLFSDNWPCCYWHDETYTMLIVYVDDMEISGPKIHMAKHWENLGNGIRLTVPPGDNPQRATFLACDHVRSTKQVKGKLL